MSDSHPEQVRRREHTLLGTTDAMIWAEEFCRIFDSKVIMPQGLAQVRGVTDAVDEGTMVGWFANAIEVGRSAGQGQVVTAQTNDDGTISLIHELDMARDVRISPQLLMQMIDQYNENVRSQDEEPSAMEEAFMEGFNEGRP